MPSSAKRRPQRSKPPRATVTNSRSPAVVAAQLAARHDQSWLRELVSRLDIHLRRAALERLITLWGISSADAAGILGISRQALARWMRVGPPTDGAPMLAAIEEATDLLARHLKSERIPTIVRRPSGLTGERSLLELAAAHEHERLLNAVRAMFDLRRPSGDAGGRVTSTPAAVGSRGKTGGILKSLRRSALKGAELEIDRSEGTVRKA